MKSYWLLALLLVTGCGSTPQAKTPTGNDSNGSSGTSTATSTWAGTFTGKLNTAGCPSMGPCSGDSFTVVISEAADPAIPSEFVPTITITGTQNAQPFTGTGQAIYFGSPVAGPGTTTTNAYLTTNTGIKLFFQGTGSSTTSAPVLVNSISVHNLVMVSGQGTIGPQYFGMLTRSAN